MKKARIGLMVLGVILIVSIINGCSTVSSTSTTTTNTSTTTSVASTSTTTSSSTTTTSATGYSISGYISPSPPTEGFFGTLWVGATKDPTFTTTEGWSEQIFYIGTAEAVGGNYTLSGLENGTYYVIGVLYRMRWITSPEGTVSGDKLGEYSDGLIPVSLGGSGTPEAIIISGSDATGKAFSLNFTQP